MGRLINGRDLVVMTGSVSGLLTRVAGSRDCEISVEGSLREVVQTDGSRRMVGDVYGWSVTTSGLYTVGNSADLCDAVLNGDLLHIGVDVEGAVWTGRGYVTDWSAQGQVKGKVTYNLTIVGSGALTLENDE